MDLSVVLAVTGTSVAVITDLVTGKVYNRWIILGWIAGITFQMARHGPEGILVFLAGACTPLLLCGWLAATRMLGAGDVKLFSFLGGILGVTPVFRCIIYSFFSGAVLSVSVLCISGDLLPRLMKFKNYIRTCISDKKLYSYEDSKDQVGKIHFTAAILMGVLLWAGGL